MLAVGEIRSSWESPSTNPSSSASIGLAASPAKTRENLRFQPGTLIEVSGPEARQAAARLLAAYPACPAAWVEQSLSPFPDEVRRFRLAWDKVLFVEGGNDSSWALSSFLRSGLFPFVVYAAPYGNDQELRKIRRQARKSGTMAILLRTEPLPAWQFQAQYLAQDGRLALVRGKGA